MATKGKFIPADVPSREDMESFFDWMKENTIEYADNVKVKDIVIDKRKTIVIQDLKLPNKFLECPVKYMYEKFSEVHPIKLWNDDGLLTLYFDGVLDPEFFKKSNYIILRTRKTKIKIDSEKKYN